MIFLKKTFINDYLFLDLMGRIKTQLVKRTTEEIYEKYADSVSKEFEDNKRLLDSKMNIKSKKMRNVIAGYLTRLKKKEM